MPIHVSWLPVGTSLFRSKSSGAVTEVRAPAALLLGPFKRCLLLDVERGFRFKPVGCPRGRFPCDPNPAERTRRFAPPPPVFWSLATVVFRGGSSGISAACDSASQWNGCPMIQIQRSGHRGPRSCDPLSGPWPRWSLVEDPGGVPIQDCCLTSGTGVCTGLPYGGLGRAASPPFVFRPLSFDRTFELSTTSHDGRLEADFSVRRQISGLSATPTPRAVHWAR